MVFQLVPARKKWSFTILYSFSGTPDGAEPVGINYDAANGALYGATAGGGTVGTAGGTLFKLVKNGSAWTETILHNFGEGGDGFSPNARPLIDRTTGVLYGTTLYGGANGGGVVYAVQP